MRMRRKKNLEERLAQCGSMILYFRTEDRNFKTAVLTKEYMNFSEIFGNSNPIYLEIGCGKGGFAIELAKQNPNINILALEKTSNVLVEGAEKAIEAGISRNLRFVSGGAELLQKYIEPHTIERIYLNFSCPFPKKQYANSRLTNPKFLNIYRDVLAQNAQIHQKTDNMHFFEYSIEQYTNCGYLLKNISLDLHNSSFEGNIQTEYEKRFSKMGMPIYRLEASAAKDS